MQVVLLAAGMGLRLGPLTRTAPKALVPLKNAPLLDYSLRPLLANKKVTEVLVVGGFEFSSLEAHIKRHYAVFGDRVRILKNANFTKGNLFSLGAALPHLEGSFLVCNVDHLYDGSTWRYILQERNALTVFCDFLRDFQEDEMKVSLDSHNRLAAIGKRLQQYDGAYVGLTYVPAGELPIYRQAYQACFHEVGDGAVVEDVLSQLIQRDAQIQVVSFDQFRWYEVDTREDLAKAESALADRFAWIRNGTADNS